MLVYYGIYAQFLPIDTLKSYRVDLQLQSSASLACFFHNFMTRMAFCLLLILHHILCTGETPFYTTYVNVSDKSLIIAMKPLKYIHVWIYLALHSWNTIFFHDSPIIGYEKCATTFAEPCYLNIFNPMAQLHYSTFSTWKMNHANLLMITGWKKSISYACYIDWRGKFENWICFFFYSLNSTLSILLFI